MFVPLTPLEFRDRAESIYANKIGVIDGDREFTYREFAQRTHMLANGLRALGLEKGERVSFITYNCHQLLEAYFGVLEAGGVLNPVNIRLSPQDIAYILNHAGAKALFFHNDFLPLVNSIKGSLEAIRYFVAIEGSGEGIAGQEYESILAQAGGPQHASEIDENKVAELFYTSGTTGKPKGVALTHRALYLHALNAALGLRVTDQDVILHIVPLFHVNGWGTPQFLTMMGGTHVMLRKTDPAILLKLVQQRRVTFMLAVPSILNALLNFPDLDKYDLSSVRVVVLGGAPSAPALVKRVQEKFGCPCIVGYGLSETSPILSLSTPKAHLEADGPEVRLERKAKTGYAIPGVNLRVVDGQGLDVQADGKQIGQVVVRSNVVMEGYYRDPDATRSAIRDGWFYTGDMATIDDEGYVLIVDRSKDIIISGGENISSVEIENILISNPKILECAVIAVPDDEWGEVPKAIVALKPGQVATERELIDYCRSRLAGFKMIKSVEFRDALPKGGTGKILKSQLREPFWQGRVKRVN